MEKDKVCVFGMGSYYFTKRDSIIDKYDIVSAIDNRVPSGKTETIDGIVVFNPNDWLNKENEIDIILMAADWYGMWRQLKDHLISDSRILLAYDMLPFYDVTEETLTDNNINIKFDNNQIIIADLEGKHVLNSEEEFKKYLRKVYRSLDPLVEAIASMPLRPSSTRFGLERGKPIDRVFIEKFLADNKEYIHGTVIEIGDNRYMSQYAQLIENPVIMHVNGWGGMKGNLATGEGIVDNYADCLICTQTLQHIYDIQPCIENIYRLLKPGGTALITNGYIGELSMYDYKNWGEFWKFTDMTAEKLFSRSFDNSKINVNAYGNVKAAIGFLYGMCAEDMPNDVFEYSDSQYPMIVAVRATK